MEGINNKLSKELFVACGNGNLERVKDIIFSDKIIDINYTDKFGRHPFHRACCENHLEIVKFLIKQNKYEINVNLQSNNSNTAISEALCSGHLKIVKFLLFQNRYYMNINIKNNCGNTLLNRAKIFGYNKIVKFIEDIVFFKIESQILLLIFNRKEILPYEMIDMIIKIIKDVEIKY